MAIIHSAALLLVFLLPFSRSVSVHSSFSVVVCTCFPQKIQIQLNLSSNPAVGENWLSELRQIRCLRSDHKVTDDLPERNLVLVGAGFLRSCGISFDRSLVCCVITEGGRRFGESTSVQLGKDRVRAICSNDTVFCCGGNGFSLPESLRTVCFDAIEEDRRIFCGVETWNCTMLCWGNEAFDSDPLVFYHVVTGSFRRRDDNACCALGFMICQTGDLILPNWANHRASQPPPPPPPGEKWSSKMVAFVVVVCVGSSLLLVLLMYLFLRCIKNRADTGIHDYHGLEEGSEATDQSNLERFSFEVLLNATDNFSEDLKIGSRGSVYHATLADGRQVAVKRVESSASLTRERAFSNEVENSSHSHHHNIVKLLGYCEHPNELLLVYEHMENGTLYDHLHKLQTPSLMSWPNRIKVALDVATGIEYFHEYAQPCIIHRDIKPSNILLDAKWMAKVSGFGLSLMRPLYDGESYLSVQAAGTIGYIDPEYYRLQQLTKKSDVYSFGIVLLELLSGCRAIHMDENGKPRNIVDFVVPYVMNDEIHRVLDAAMPPPTPFEMVAVAYVGYLAADCLAPEGGGRPSMFELVTSLERAWGACLAPIELYSSCH